jgi:hypothetical protein
MPTPLELLLDPLTLSVIGIFAALALWEALFPARRLPRVRAWRTKGLLAFIAFMAVSSYLPFLWAAWLAPIQLFDLSGWSTLAGAVVGVLLYEAGVWACTARNSCGATFTRCTTAPSVSIPGARSGSARWT